MQEKVKDIVKVETYQSLRDYMADPTQTLASYHFTDGTAEMMAKWIDSIASVSANSGSAFALAGYRGVGKSHFLAALGAIVSKPDLRSRITDTHVSASAQRLSRKHYPVAYVKRGTEASLLDELKLAIADTCDLDPAKLPDAAEEIIDLVAKNAGELPFILVVDTALERGARVSRDDGDFLGQLAKAAQTRNVFVAVALDDDIAGADGMNAAIAKTFTIEYLDQEHLYKVVNSYIFPKNHQLMPVLHEVHKFFQQAIPSFRWSEQRFTSLYPLHPIILEVAPFIRLFVQDFALLAFASSAGTRILGRPANSLIALDEVFDSVEKDLRNIADLGDAFAAYDRLNEEVVADIPVMQRLQAKLILKALLLLSLEGEGTTAREISAAMLIFDEDDPEKAIETIQTLVKQFSEFLPEDVQIYQKEGREDRYGFRLASKDDLNRALTEAGAEVSADVVPKIIRRMFTDKFADTRTSDSDAVESDVIESNILWRGGNRRGRIHLSCDQAVIDGTSANDEEFDWNVFVDLSGEVSESAPKLERSKVIWRADALRQEEIETIRRFHALSTKTSLRDEFGDQLTPSIHAHTITIEKIATRIFLEDGKLLIDGFDYNFTDPAREAETVSELLSVMLEPQFATTYPEHPKFSATLGLEEVAAIVSDLYSGDRQNLPEVQKLAATFAEPLGLVRLQGDVYTAETEEQLMKLPLVAEIMKIVPTGTSTVSLKNIYAQLRKEPYGLVREAQHLILAALVAQRQIEFVTSKGDRINRRSLDLKIIWEDIVAVARPTETSYSAKKLALWASMLTGDESIKSIDRQEDRNALNEVFTKWLNNWKENDVLNRFNEIPDEVLNTRIWRIAARLTKTYGSVAESVEALLANSISVDEALARIADAFSDSETEFKQCSSELVVLDDFIKGVGTREKVRTYLSLCEPTDDSDIEGLRDSLAKIAETSYFYPSEKHNREMGYAWDKFRKSFSEYFAGHHDVVMRSKYLHEKFDEIKRSDKWWEFENLSTIELFEPTQWIAAKKITRQLRQLDCKADVRKMLSEQPFCICSFSLTKLEYWERLPQTLMSVIDQGLKAYREKLREVSEDLRPRIQSFAAGALEAEVKEASLNILEALETGGTFRAFSGLEIKILQEVLARPSKDSFGRISTFSMSDVSTDDLDTEFSSWVEEQTDEEMLLNI